MNHLVQVLKEMETSFLIHISGAYNLSFLLLRIRSCALFCQPSFKLKLSAENPGIYSCPDMWQTFCISFRQVMGTIDPDRLFFLSSSCGKNV